MNQPTDQTPADSPQAKRMSRPDASEMNGEDHGPRLSEKPPALEPLPVNPSPLDVALRYGSFAAFITVQWPLLVREVKEQRKLIELARTAHWVWPLLVGMLAVAALVGWLRN